MRDVLRTLGRVRLRLENVVSIPPEKEAGPVVVVETPMTARAPADRNAGSDDPEAGNEGGNTFEEPPHREDFHLAKTAPKHPYNLAEDARATFMFMAFDAHVLRVLFWTDTAGYGGGTGGHRIRG